MLIMDKQAFRGIVTENQDVFADIITTGQGGLRTDFRDLKNSVRFTLFSRLQLACGNITPFSNTVSKAIQRAFGEDSLEDLKNRINQGEEHILCKINKSKGKESRTLVAVSKDMQVQFMKKTIALYREAK